MNSIYAAVDVETTGLKQGPDKLLEIAVYPVGSASLKVLDEDGYHAIVKYDKRVAGRMRAAADPFVQKMHDKTGLWRKLSGDGAKPLGQIDAELVEYLSRFGAPGEMPVMGNSVRLDMNFIDTFLPNTASHLSYHMRDVSTVGGLATDWFGFSRFEKKLAHTAKGDILECIEELRYYRNAMLYPGRGGKLTPVSETKLIQELKVMAFFAAGRDRHGDLINLADFTRERMDKALMAAAVALGGTPERFTLRDTTEDEPLEGEL